MGTFMLCWWESKGYTHYGKQFGSFFIKLNTHDIQSRNPILLTYASGNLGSHRNLYAHLQPFYSYAPQTGTHPRATRLGKDERHGGPSIQRNTTQ